MQSLAEAAGVISRAGSVGKAVGVAVSFIALAEDVSSTTLGASSTFSVVLPPHPTTALIMVSINAQLLRAIMGDLQSSMMIVKHCHVAWGKGSSSLGWTLFLTNDVGIGSLHRECLRLSDCQPVCYLGFARPAEVHSYQHARRAAVVQKICPWGEIYCDLHTADGFRSPDRNSLRGGGG